MRPQLGVMTMGRAEAGLLVASGSSDISSLHLTGEINWRTLSTRTSADIAVNRAQTLGIETASNLTSAFRHKEFLTDHVYANGNVILTNDRFRDITLRTAPGVGVGYQFSQFAVTTLSLVRTRSGVHVLLTGGLIMTGELGLNYDRRPPLGQDHVDRTFAITLGYQLGY